MDIWRNKTSGRHAAARLPLRLVENGWRMVTPMRFELMALGLGILRSILLSYGVSRVDIAKAERFANVGRGGSGPANRKCLGPFVWPEIGRRRRAHRSNP